MSDSVSVCLWGLISMLYINCLDSVCRQALSILLQPPTALHPLFALGSILSYTLHYAVFPSLNKQVTEKAKEEC